MLALNIVQKSFAQLLQPLEHRQVAPILFLLIEKTFSLFLPNSEYGLRLFPLICYIAATYCFYKIINKQLHNTHTKTIAAALFAFGYVIIYYSSETKQYMTDLFVMMSMSWITVRKYKKESTQYIIAGITGCVAVFLSNIAPVVLLTCGICKIYNDIHEKKHVKPRLTATVALAWIAAFLVYYALFIHKHPSQQFMINYWTQFDHTFMPTNPLSTDFYLYIFKLLPTTLFAPVFGLNINKTRTLAVVILMTLLFICGIVKLGKKKQFNLILLACLPIIIHLTLSAIKLYPLEKRLILYMIPGIIILCATGIDEFLQIALTKLKLIKLKSVTVTAAVLLIIASLLVRFPEKFFDLKGQLQFVNENISKCDEIYVCAPGALMAMFSYYLHVGKVNEKLDVKDKQLMYDQNYWENNDRELFVYHLTQTLNNQAWIVLPDKCDEIKTLLDQHNLSITKHFEGLGSSIWLVTKKKTTFND